MRGSRLGEARLDRIIAEGQIGTVSSEKTEDTRPMTVLEKAVQSLAEAIETLESRLDARLDDASANEETVTAARRQAAVARKQTDTASQGVAGAISDLKAILAEDDRKKGNEA